MTSTKTPLSHFNKVVWQMYPSTNKAAIDSGKGLHHCFGEGISLEHENVILPGVLYKSFFSLILAKRCLSLL